MHVPLHSHTLWIVTFTVASALSAHATDGYFSDGYGIKAKGRAGVAITESDDAFAGANNPATLALAADRIDFGIDLFRPSRSAKRTGPAVPLNGSVESVHENFFIPEVGYKQSIGNQWALGIAIYGNGGMNTDYPAGQLNLGPGASSQNLLAGPGHLGVSLSQLLIAPTAAWKFAEGHSIGIAPVIAYQQFQAYGLGAFAPLSQDPDALSDSGTDYSWGIGARLGYLWAVTPSISWGVTYSSRVYSGDFDRYRGLFAGNGLFDIPQSVATGLGWQARPDLRFGIDYKWIDYSSIAPVGNAVGNPGLLGQSSGPGFAWRSISVIKLGADWQLNPNWTFRAGYSFNENPVIAEAVTFNILAPGVIQHHLTAGITFSTGHHELSLAYMHGFFNSVTGPSRFAALGLAPAGTQEEISMAQDSVGLAYSFKF